MAESTSPRDTPAAAASPGAPLPLGAESAGAASTRPEALTVAIDGPAASGKSSVGAMAAARLGYRFLDTGLLYRAITWLALRRSIEPTDPAGLVALVDEVELLADADGRLSRVAVDGADVTDEAHGPDVDARVSAISRVPELRAALLDRQRSIAAGGGIVMAGRDIGTVVLPQADLKLFLDASVEERAARRAAERGAEAGSLAARAILRGLRDRDRLDTTRNVAPLRAAPDAVHLTTDGNAIETTVQLVVDAIRSRAAEVGAADRADGPVEVTATAPAMASAATDPSATDRAASDPAAAAAADAATIGRAGRPNPVRSSAASGTRRSRPPIDPTPVATRFNAVITIGSLVMRFLVRLFTTVRFEGDLDAVPRSGGILIAANHASNADPVLIGAFLAARLGRPINWLGKREVFDWPVVSWLARHGGVHPVERGAADVEAFRSAIRILEAGHVMAVFPEGTRSPDGRLQHSKDGTAALGLRPGVTVVPIAIANSDRLWPKGRALPRFTKVVTVSVGSPFELGPAVVAADPVAARDRRRAKAMGTELIMRRIAALLPPRQRGVYADAPAD